MKPKPQGIASLATVFLILAPAASAGPFRVFDNGSGDGDFGTAANWDSNTVPNSTEGAVINHISPDVTLRITSDQSVDTLRISDGRTVTQTAGNLTISNANNELGLWIGEFNWDNVYNMNGGSIVVEDTLDGIILGKTQNSQGTMNFTGGTITNTAGDTFIGADREGIWNQTGGTFIAGTVYLSRWNWNKADPSNIEKGIVNLDGGTFSATQVRRGDGDEAFFNFNGGLLQARTHHANFLHSLTRANVRDGGAIIDTNGFDVTISQALLHSDLGGDNPTDGGLTKIGDGVLTLSGAGSFTGDTRVNAGTLAISGGGSLYNGEVIDGNLIVNAGGTLRFDRYDTFGNAATTNPVTLTVNAGGNVLANGNFNSIHHVVINGGTITADAGLFIEGTGEIGAFGFNGTVTANGSAPGTVAAGVGDNNFIRIGREGTSESTTFNVTDSSGLLRIDAELHDNFHTASGLVKSGSGTLVLNGNSSFNGTTVVQAGQLVINGSLGGSGSLEVYAGAVLSGTGTVAGNTTVAGSHSVAHNSGPQSFGGNLTYSGTSSIFEWEIEFDEEDTDSPLNGGSTYSQVVVTGMLAGSNGGEGDFHVQLGGGDFSTPFWSVSRTWTDIFSASNDFALDEIFSGFTYDSGVSPTAYGTMSFNGSSLMWSAVPEPKGFFAGMLLAAGLIRRRRLMDKCNIYVNKKLANIQDNV